MVHVSSIGARLIVGALCLMVCAVPLVLPRGIYEPAFSPKFFSLHLSIAMAGLGWIIQTRWGRNFRVSFNPLLIPALGFLCAALLSAPSTTHPLDTLVEVVNLAALFVLFFVVANTLSPEQIRPILLTSSVTGLVVAVIGILQFHGLAFLDIPSCSSPQRHLAADYLVCAIPLSGFLFFTSNRRIVLVISGLSTTLMGVYLIYTRARGAWVGMTGALLLVAVFVAIWPGLWRPVMEALRAGLRGKRWLAGGALILFAALSVLPADPSSHRSRSPYLTETKADILTTAASVFGGDLEVYHDRSHRERLAMWRSTLSMVAENPLLGVGPGGWKRVYPLYDGGATIEPYGTPRRPHNDFLWIAAEFGLIGLCVYLWLLTAVFRCLFQLARHPLPDSRILGVMLAICILSYLGTSFFGFPREHPQATMFVFLAFGIIAGATGGDPIDLRKKGLFILVPLLIVLLSGVGLSWFRVRFDRHYLNTLYLGKVRRDWPGLLEEFPRALENGLFRPHILAFKGVALQHLERLEEAGETYLRALGYTPHAWRIHSGLGSVYLQQGRLDEALSHFQVALSICPDALDVRSNLAMVHHQMGDLPRALEEIRTVLKADPRDVRAHHYLGNLFVAMNQPDSAIVEYQKALRIDPLPYTHTNLADIYRIQGRLKEALPHYLEAVRAFPDKQAIQWGLGLSLEAAGRLPEAEAALRKAVEIQPGFAQGSFSLGNLFFDQGRYSDALEAYRTFLNHWRGDPSFTRFAHDRVVDCEIRIKQQATD